MPNLNVLGRAERNLLDLNVLGVRLASGRRGQELAQLLEVAGHAPGEVLEPEPEVLEPLLVLLEEGVVLLAHAVERVHQALNLDISLVNIPKQSIKSV